jgi:hypothetical protein
MQSRNSLYDRKAKAGATDAGTIVAANKRLFEAL